ncbi:von Willebrand factor A domain-containing protein 8 [Geodia barretti]|nr:von Willebrand factor A domain-containing protein 8 [Geodia barretti]
MYRFNSYDGRLERSLEAVLVVMEAFDKQPNFKLDIVGHSGDSIEVPFVESSNPPANDKERLQVLKAMIAESQYCWSGDNTMEATRAAIQQISKEPADEYFVIVFSDANFSRYGIRPSHFASLMNSDPRVNVFAIFIGSLGDQAKRLREALPSGRSLICMNNKDLPQQLQQILASTIK